MIPVWKVYLRVAWACKTPFVLPFDVEYKEVTYRVLIDIAKTIKETFKYITDVSDCDDAAWQFKAVASHKKENGVGLVVGWHNGLHCWNVVLRDFGTTQQIEPQTGNPVGKGYHAFLAEI